MLAIRPSTLRHRVLLFLSVSIVAFATIAFGYLAVSSASTLSRARAEDGLEAFVAAAAHDAGLATVDHELIVAEREASHLLCEVAQGAELLVIGSRGLGGFQGLVLGSVSARCANVSPCPVAIIPEGWSPARPQRNVVAVGVDGSPNAAAAVAWADQWAPAEHTLRLVGAWSYPVSFTLAELDQLIPYLLTFTAASFLYVAVSDLMPALNRRIGARAGILQVLLIGGGIGVNLSMHAYR